VGTNSGACAFSRLNETLRDSDGSDCEEECAASGAADSCAIFFFAFCFARVFGDRAL
jgi:hypothetical protein